MSAGPRAPQVTTPDALTAGAAAAYGGLGLHVRGATGDRVGEHRVTGRPQASGLEIESYRPYAHGDDLRHLDWSALARLDVLVTRRFTAEREQPVHLVEEWLRALVARFTLGGAKRTGRFVTLVNSLEDRIKARSDDELRQAMQAVARQMQKPREWR